MISTREREEEKNEVREMDRHDEREKTETHINRQEQLACTAVVWGGGSKAGYRSAIGR